MKIKAIKTATQYASAIAEIERIWNAPVGSETADRLEVLVILAEAYEEEHYPVPPPDPVEAIKFELERRGLTAKDLEPVFGSRARVWEVLHRKRDLTLAMIRALRDRLGFSVDALVG
jgi:HTH-type transcriptional regulator/antitoxin HigA